MPRYYFHVDDDRTNIDEEGMTLPNLAATNRTIIAFGLLLCVALAVGGAYVLGLLEMVGLLH